MEILGQNRPSAHLSFLHFSPQKQSDSVKLIPYTTSLLENLGDLSRSLWQFGIKPITLYRRQHKIIGLLKTVNALCRNISDQSSLLAQTFWRAVEMGGDKLEWVTLNAPQRRRSDFYKSPVLFLPKSILVQLE